MCVGSWVWFLEGMSIVALLTECTKGGILLRTKRVGASSFLGKAVLAKASQVPAPNGHSRKCRKHGASEACRERLLTSIAGLQHWTKKQIELDLLWKTSLKQGAKQFCKLITTGKPCKKTIAEKW